MNPMFNEYKDAGKIQEALLIGRNMVNKAPGDSECVNAYLDFLLMLAEKLPRTDERKSFADQANLVLSFYEENADLTDDIINDIHVYHNRLGAVVTDIAQLEQEEYEKQKRAIEATNTTQIKKLYITNTALYPLMGIEVGTTVHFPMTTQELQAALAKIGIDGKRYSEVFFTSFDSDVLGLYDHLYECENIDELNELGHALLEVRDKGGLETFEAALVLGNHTRSVKDLINLTQNLDLYRFYPDISDDEGLGRLYADELGTIDIPEHIQNYFDYEAYGRDVRINEGGVFAPGGYVSAVPEGFKEYYHGPQDIPPEHRIFAYPEKAEPVHSILATLKRFQEAPPAPKKDKAGPSHEER